jgi:hypothetical protein
LRKISSAYFFNDGLRSYKNLPWLNNTYSASVGNAGMTVYNNRLGRYVKKTTSGYTYLFSGTIAQGASSYALLGCHDISGAADLFGDGAKDWKFGPGGVLQAYFSSGSRGLGTTVLGTGNPIVVSVDSVDSATKGYVNGVLEISFSGWGSSGAISRIGYTNNAGGQDAVVGAQVFLGFSSVLTAAEHKIISDILLRDPMELFAPLQPVLWVPSSGSSLSGSATGGAAAGGTANLAAQVALAGVGVATAGGSAVGSVAVPLSAAGISVAGGSAAMTATVSISAAGLAQAAGTAGLSASVLLAASGAALASGNAVLAAQLSAMASGSAQAGGSANLSGGATGAISASGGAVSGGTAVLKVTVQLAATGGAQAGGSANLSGGPQGAIAASGGAVAGGSGTLSVTVAITAAGFVQAMGAGVLWVSVRLSATGAATAGGSAVLTLLGASVPVIDARYIAQRVRRDYTSARTRRDYEVRA